MRNVRLMEAVEYPMLVGLMKRSALIITDSGGIQEEAPSLGSPVLVIRTVTERPEAVEAGFAQLVGTDRAAVVAAAEFILNDPDRVARAANKPNPFGDGHAAERIVAVLSETIP